MAIAEGPEMLEYSVGREIGVMFAFIGSMLVCAAAYVVGFRLANRRSDEKEARRREDLTNRGLGPDLSILKTLGAPGTSIGRSPTEKPATSTAPAPANGDGPDVIRAT